jgi:hypothetical protein
VAIGLIAPARASSNGALPRWSWQSATGTGRTTVQCFRMPKNQPRIPDDPAPPTGEIVLYQTEDGRTRVECRFVDETLWLSQVLIGELFQKDVRTVNEHLQNIYQEGEIEEQATIRKFRMVRREGPREVERDIEDSKPARRPDRYGGLSSEIDR